MNFAVHAQPGAEPDVARARAFAVARRHSWRVRAMRRALELAVVGGLAALAVVAAYRTFGHRLGDVSFQGIGLEGGRITMDRPHLTGARPGGGGYDITAVKAMQDSQHPGAVDLALIGGEIVTPDHEVSRLSASSGHYETADETLTLSGEVRLKNPRYEIDLRSVRIAFKKGEYVSDEPVAMRILPDMAITADAVSVSGGGAQATFTGHVRSVIHAEGAGATP